MPQNINDNIINETKLDEEFSRYNILSKLIACQSVTPIDDGAIYLVEQYLNKLGFTTYVEKFSEAGYDDVLNLYAVRKAIKNTQKTSNLCFAGHVDVVPAGDKEKWSYPPFEMKFDEEKKYVYGRGVVDMKGAIACFIEALYQFLKNITKPDKKQNQLNTQNDIAKIDTDKSYSLLITGDEEGIAINGTKKMLQWMKKNQHNIDYVIVGEPTADKLVGDYIKVGRRGSVNFDLTIFGKQGHVAYPEKAKNPITQLVKILDYLKNYTIDTGNQFFQKSNLEITNLEVGNKTTNLIPNEAKATLNIRFNDIHSGKSLTEWITKSCDKIIGQNNYKIESKIAGEAFLTEDKKFVELIKNSIIKSYNNQDNNQYNKHTNIDVIEKKKQQMINDSQEKNNEPLINQVKNIIVSTGGGTSDARFIKNYAKVIEVGLANSTAHKIDENSTIYNVDKLTMIYHQLLHDFEKSEL